MEFKQLQSFTAVVKYRSFTRAAESLFLSQSTVSSHVQALEEELHKRLLLRTTKSLEVTPKGREVYDYAVNILAMRDRMVQECREEGERIIHLGASTIPSAYILPEVLPEYGKAHPQIYFNICQSDSQGVIDGLLDGLFDLGLTGMDCSREELASAPFCEDRMVFITPINDHFLKLKARTETQSEAQLGELLQQPMILREKGSGSKKMADHFLEGMGMSEEDIHVTARVNDQEAIKSLVAGGLGISVISERAARNFVEAKRLLMFDLPGHAARRKLYIVYRRNYILKGFVKEFMGFLRRYYG